ncbi:leucyl-tRNA synthetase [Diaporthe helianthi]|uniref:Leucyl-tRNA synthetase n=1 Tax=Diaporthe helianthi TaxID=158607 RepID=A0A2P5I8U7_DIAHE|nr:leucyl-tRNA synthetase [Diaporthe helianthi]
MSKVEFATGYARMKGKRALFPLGFHCTGMAIKACADKLAREIELFGPTFEGCPDDADDADYEEGLANAAKPVSAPSSRDVTKFKSNKTKASAKSIKAKY